MPDKIVLILTVGGSPEPIQKSIDEHKPHYIYFLPSKDTLEKVDIALANVSPSIRNAVNKKYPIGDPGNLLSCFKACRLVFDDIRKLKPENYKLIIDLTGGTKLMSAALALAAGDYGVEVSYVGGDVRNKEGVGTVVTGQERVIHCVHPFDFISRSLREQFCNSFNGYRFETALDICRKIGTSGSEASQKIFKALGVICEGYRDWDLFRYKSVNHTLKKGVNELRRLSTDYPNDIEHLLSPFIRAVLDNLKELKSRTLDGYHDDNVRELVGNALRRSEEGKYDDAVARLYRALELIAQVEFQKLFGATTSNFPCDKVPETTRNRLDLRPNKTGKIDIGSRNAFEILYDMGNARGKMYKEYEREIRSLLSARNSSILAHGLSPLEEKDFAQMYEIFRNIFGDPIRPIQFARIERESIFGIGFEEGRND